jgi:hypothetical protein
MKVPAYITMSKHGTKYGPKRYIPHPDIPRDFVQETDKMRLFSSSGGHTSWRIKAIERSQRLDRFLQDKDDQVVASRSRGAETEMPSVADKEKELERFMDSVTDNAMVEDAKMAWEKKI